VRAGEGVADGSEVFFVLSAPPEPPVKVAVGLRT
jgi:hypothetical protein